MGLSKNKKTGLLILIALGIAALLVGPGIYAYFSDQVESQNPSLFTAGTIVMEVDKENPWTGTFDAALTNLVPGMTGTGSVPLKNAGTNPFDAWLMITDVKTDAGAETVPEAKEDAATDIDTVMRYGLTIDTKPKIEADDNIFISKPQHHLAGSGSEMKDQWIYLGEVPAGTTRTVDQTFTLDPKTTNWAQGDTMSFKVTFYAQQSEGEPKPSVPTPELSGHGRP